MRSFLNSDSSAFKTYKDRAYGISVKYPKGWKKKDKVKEAVVLFIAPQTSSAFAANINITVQDLSSEETTLDKYLESMIEREKGFIPDYQLIDTQPAILAGTSAYKITFTGKQGYINLKFMQVCTIKNQRAYAITCAAEASAFPDFLIVAQEVIDSFAIKP